jgi:hypothetical protein
LTALTLVLALAEGNTGDTFDFIRGMSNLFRHGGGDSMQENKNQDPKAHQRAR